MKELRKDLTGFPERSERENGVRRSFSVEGGSHDSYPRGSSVFTAPETL
jgi:hypothetical protein